MNSLWAARIALAMGVALSSLGCEARGEALPGDDFSALVARVMARDHVPGVAVGVVEHGRLVYARGFGERDVQRHLPVTPDTLFALGSCSKAFTALAVAMLADEGHLALDAPVRTYLPDFALADPVATTTLTPRDLLTHRSGLPRHDLFWHDTPLSRDEMYARLRFLEPSGPPHARWQYNSLMYVVAGRLIERVSGSTWEDFVQTRILAPLKMRRTVLSAEAMTTDPDHASPYAMREGGLGLIAVPRSQSASAPAGGVHSSVRDLARWLAFHATRSPPLLSETLWRELHRPQAAMPPADPPEVQHASYAFGWVHEEYRGRPLVVHNGAIDGYTVHLGFVPATGQGLIVLTNRDTATEAVLTLVYSAYDRMLGLAPLDWERRIKEVPLAMQGAGAVALDIPVDEIAGRYEHPAYGALTVEARGEALVMVFRDHCVPLVYQGNGRFLGAKPITDGAPQISVQFSPPTRRERAQLTVPLNFDAGDPVEVFTRVRRGTDFAD